MLTLIWLASTVLHKQDGLEPTDRLIPAGWQGNPWGPEALKARQTGVIPPLPMSDTMKQWDAWGRQVLKTGDVLFRRGDAKLLRGYFPFSRFLANISGSQFSHTGIAAVEGGEVVVYDTTKAGVRRQPFCVWILDNSGPFGVKRVKPEYQPYAEKAVAYCRDLFQKQLPFDYELSDDDRAFYCVEMTDKAYRNSGLPLAAPVRLADMENINEFPVCVTVFLKLSDLKLDQLVFFPGNDKHGIWSSSKLMTVYAPPRPANTTPAALNAAAAAFKRATSGGTSSASPKPAAGRPASSASAAGPAPASERAAALDARRPG